MTKSEEIFYDPELRKVWQKATKAGLDPAQILKDAIDEREREKPTS